MIKLSIRKINPSKIDWKQRAYSRSKYKKLHNAIWTMQTETAIKVIFPFPVKHLNSVLQNFRRKRTAKKGFCIKLRRLDKLGKIWAIRKDKKVENK